MPHSDRVKRAFTLLEVTVALALGIVVLGTVTGVYVGVVADHKRVQALAEMARDGGFVGQLLSRELRQAGLGVRVPAPPSSSAQHTDAGYGTVTPQVFYSGLIVGAADQVGVLADFPRPDANYPTYGPIHSRPTGTVGSPHAVMWHNENNGGCAPDTGAGTSCVTGDFSVFFPGEDGCAGAGVNDRTCPWGLRRVVPNERLQVFAGNGSWVHSAATGSTASVANGTWGVVSLPLQTSFDTTAWGNTVAGDSPVGNVGVGWVTTLDRVFYWRDAATSTIRRQQCAGDPDPNHASFPPPTGTAVPANPRLTPAGVGTLAPAQNVCTMPEIVARNVSAFTLTYFDVSNNAVAAGVLPLATAAAKQSVRRIDYVVSFQTTVKGRPLTHSVVGAVRIQNL